MTKQMKGGTMSFFLCTCGYRIGFNVCPCRNDGDVMGHRDRERADDLISREVEQYLAAVREGRRDSWLREFYLDVFPIEDASVISDIFARTIGDLSRAIHQCERCGRLWLQAKPGENTYASYLPEGAWRGALEAPPEGFLGYLDGQDFFDAVIAEIKQEGGTVRVVLQKEDGQNREVEFTGVAAVKQYDTTEKRIRFMSEWSSAPPLRRFVFDSSDQSSEPLLDIAAREVRFVS
jgi:hypothetical protein